eukprot:757508-Hanusia_phi.AAC.2
MKRVKSRHRSVTLTIKFRIKSSHRCRRHLRRRSRGLLHRVLVWSCAHQRGELNLSPSLPDLHDGAGAGKRQFALGRSSSHKPIALALRVRPQVLGKLVDLLGVSHVADVSAKTLLAPVVDEEGHDPMRVLEALNVLCSKLHELRHDVREVDGLELTAG